MPKSKGVLTKNEIRGYVNVSQSFWKICCIYTGKAEPLSEENGVSTQPIGDMRNLNIYVSIDVEMDLAL